MGFTSGPIEPGSAITAAPSYRPPLELVLRKPEPRTVKVEGPDGGPVAGAIVSPRVVSVAGAGRDRRIPSALATPLAVTTGADGKADTRLSGGRRSIGRRASRGRVDRQPGLPVDRTARPRRPGRDNHNSPQADEPAGRPCPEPCGGTGRGPNGRGLVQGRQPAAARIQSASRTGRSARRLMARSRRPTTSWSGRRIASWSVRRGRSRSCRAGSRSASSLGSCCR